MNFNYNKLNNRFVINFFFLIVLLFFFIVFKKSFFQVIGDSWAYNELFINKMVRSFVVLFCAVYIICNQTCAFCVYDVT